MLNTVIIEGNAMRVGLGTLHMFSPVKCTGVSVRMLSDTTGEVQWAIESERWSSAFIIRADTITYQTPLRMNSCE